MHPLKLTHLSFLRSRTRIRHDKITREWIKRLWVTALQSSNTPTGITRPVYDALYRKLLVSMTIAWEEEICSKILCEMWKRDAGMFPTLDFNRFSCSIFAFVEMWVEALSIEEYARVFKLIDRVLTSTEGELVIRRSNPTPLLAFLQELQNQLALEQQNMSLGKSVSFDSERYARIFGEMIPCGPTGDNPPSSHDKRRRTTGPNTLRTLQDEVHRHCTRPRSCSAFLCIDNGHQLPTRGMSNLTLHSHKAKFSANQFKRL